MIVELAVAGCASRSASQAALADRPLVIAISGEPDNLNPIFGDIYGTIYGDKWPIFSGLLRYDHNLDLVPDLAAAMPHTSPDGRTVTVPLRTGVTFHDGQPLTADDVVFTYRSILDPTVATRVRDLLFETLAEVSAVDAHTVRFTLKRADPAFNDKLNAGIVPARLLSGQNLNTAGFNTAPVGTGPFTFDRWRKGERLELVANPSYFGGRVATPRLTFVFIPEENARIAALQNGSVDADASGIAPQNADRFRAGGFRVVQIPGDSQVIILPTTNPVLSDPLVGRAFSLAIDRQLLIDGSFRGAAQLVSGPIPPGHWADDKLAPPPRDVAQARALLSQAGWRDTDGDSILDRNGTPLRFPLIYSADEGTDKASALAVRTNLREVGADAELEGLGFDGQKQRLAQGAAILNRQATIYDPDLDIEHLFGSRFATDDDPFSDAAVLRDVAIDADVAAARATTDRTVRARHYADLQQRLRASGSWLYLVRPAHLFVVSNKVAGLNPTTSEGHNHGFSRGLLWNVEQWRFAAS